MQQHHIFSVRSRNDKDNKMPTLLLIFAFIEFMSRHCANVLFDLIALYRITKQSQS